MLVVSNKLKALLEIVEERYLSVIIASSGPPNVAVRWLSQVMLLTTTIVREWYNILDYVCDYYMFFD
jgi:hypothetical protein